MSWLAGADEVACRDDVGFEEFVELAGRILREGRVTESVAVDSEGRVVGNYGLCNTLLRLGLKRVPVSLNASQRVSYTLEELGFYDEVQGDSLRVYWDSEELLYRGWPTPLVRLKSLESGNFRVWGKLEGFNPWSMSVKDRVGWYMFLKATEKRGRHPEAVVEATSTNTGLAVAAMCAIRRSRMKAYIPSTVSKTGEMLLKIFGAEVVRSDKSLTVELIEEVSREAERLGAVNLNQFYNDANFEVHLRYTAKELELQARRAGLSITVLIGGLGTSGHLSALSFYFKNKLGDVRVYGVVPKPGTFIQGLRRPESGMRWVRYAGLDGVIEVDPRDAAMESVELARREGVFVGLSSGAVIRGFKELVERGAVPGGDVVLVLPDMGFKYVDQIAELAGII